MKLRLPVGKVCLFELAGMQLNNTISSLRVPVERKRKEKKRRDKSFVRRSQADISLLEFQQQDRPVIKAQRRLIPQYFGESN